MPETALQYQTNVYAGGQTFMCLESYESIFERMRDATLGMRGKEQADMDMTWMAPLELTARGEHGPMRVAVAVQAICYVLEVPEDHRVDLDEA